MEEYLNTMIQDESLLFQIWDQKINPLTKLQLSAVRRWNNTNKDRAAGYEKNSSASR